MTPSDSSGRADVHGGRDHGQTQKAIDAGLDVRKAEDLRAGPRRFAYADPPYPGQARRVYGDQLTYAGEVDHAELVARLERDYPDGWALSTSVSALPEVLALCPHERGTDPKNPGRVEPERSVHVMAWVKPRSAPFPVPVQYTWEPVILRRRVPRDDRFVRDHLIAPAGGLGFPGAKPIAFCRWLFAALGARPGDVLVDLFPGSGAVGREWQAFTLQLELVG
ncbi:MAG: hypothetical protein ACRDVE_03095 [Actinocrinis sp.]